MSAVFATAVARACEEPTLVLALSWIAGWEADRAIHQALRNVPANARDADGKLWDTCFRHCFEHVMVAWAKKTGSSGVNTSRDQLRADGWSVAVHNDYRLNGATMTFWLFTHPSGQWIKGEGRTDEAAIAQ